MKITSDIFEAYLKCPTKCWLRRAGVSLSNTYAEWLKSQNDSYRATETQRLVAQSPNFKTAFSPSIGNLQAAEWLVASSVTVQAQTDCCGVESELHAIEHVPSTGDSNRAEFIPIRFIFTNKLGKDEKLLLAFDAFVLSESQGREVRSGKIIHGDVSCTLRVSVSALASDVRKRVPRNRRAFG